MQREQRERERERKRKERERERERSFGVFQVSFEERTKKEERGRESK